MICHVCKKARLRRQISVFVECDEDRTNLGKRGLRSGDVKILGAGWPTSSIFCPNCGFYERLKGGPGDGSDRRKR